MPDLRFKAAAEELARRVPDYAGRSAFPPSAWWIAGDQLFVIGADGRKFAGAVPEEVLNASSKKLAKEIATDLAKDFVQPGQPTPDKAMHDRSDAPTEKASADPSSTKPASPAAAQSHEVRDPGTSIPGKSHPPAKHKAGK